jgi:carotenoid cleavage dioxygenase-like enzyme
MGLPGAADGVAGSSRTLRPFYLRDNYAPVGEEMTVDDLPVEGAIPPELSGRYLRNGPNPKEGDPGHWFFGDGMIHGVELRDGKANWYRNRWVRTRTFLDGAPVFTPDGDIDHTTGVANTHVIGHAGRIFALVESSFPTELTKELETVGPCDFGGQLTTAMTAHPKICPRTGELHFFGYGFVTPFLTYHCLDVTGTLLRSEPIEVSSPTMMHDFAITDRHVIFMDLPVCFDLEGALGGKMPFHWNDDYGARLGIMPRDGTSADVRWVEIEPCYVFHPLNAYDDDAGRIVVEVARYDSSFWRESAGSFGPARLHRWTVDLGTGTVSEQPLDDCAIEFPRMDERRLGRRHRYGYATFNQRGVSEEMVGLVKYDNATGRKDIHDFGRGRVPGEGVFIPATERAGEDEGWVLAYVYDPARDDSELVVLDAASFSGPPVARIRLPQRVPYGFHGSWIAD